MRRAVYEDTIDGTASYYGDQIRADNLTRASVVLTVSDSTADFVGVVSLQGSNEPPASILCPRDVSQDSFADIPGAALQVDDASIQDIQTLTFAVDLAYRVVRPVYRRTSGSATIDLRVELKGWP